jgi:hypothetical protein
MVHHSRRAGPSRGLGSRRSSAQLRAVARRRRRPGLRYRHGLPGSSQTTSDAPDSPARPVIACAEPWQRGSA